MQCHKRTFMKGTKRSIATQRRSRESKAELSEREQENEERAKKESGGQLKHLGSTTKASQAKIETAVPQDIS